MDLDKVDLASVGGLLVVVVIVGDLVRVLQLVSVGKAARGDETAQAEALVVLAVYSAGCIIDCYEVVSG